MASPTLPVFRSLDFPQRLSQTIDRAVQRVIFGICCYEVRLGSYNDRNSQLCNSAATVHSMEDGLDYCERHFRKVSR